MKLKSGCIFWPEIYKGPQIRAPRLERDVQCDVIVVGSGISGALAAYHLTREGLHTLMVDRRQIAHGSTAASTGLLQYEIDTSLVKLADLIGRDRAIAAYRASLESVLAFEPLVADLADSCGLIARPSFYLASSEKDVEELRVESEARRSMGIDVQFLNERALRDRFDIRRPAALWSRMAFEVDPYRLTLQLIRRSIEMGLDVYAETEIVRHTSEKDHVIVHASTGASIRAKHIVFAMGYETFDLIPDDLFRLSSTYALATEPLPSFEHWPQRCLIWEAARPYLYMRTTEDNRAIVGGGDEDIVDPKKRDALLEQKAVDLIRKFSELFPQIPVDTTCAWAGTFAQTKDGLPYIGALPKMPRAYFALGYGGNGITFSLLAAQIIRDLILGRANQCADLFGFNR